MIKRKGEIEIATFLGWVRNGKPLIRKIFHSIFWIFVHALLFVFLLEYLKARYGLVAFIIFFILPQIGLYFLLRLINPSKESLMSKIFIDRMLLWGVSLSFVAFLAEAIYQRGWGFLDYNFYYYLNFDVYTFVLLFVYAAVISFLSLSHVERHVNADAQIKYDISQQTKKINSLNRKNKELESKINEADKQIQEISKPLLKIEERILELKKDISNEKKLFATLKKKYPFLSSGKIIDNR